MKSFTALTVFGFLDNRPAAYALSNKGSFAPLDALDIVDATEQLEAAIERAVRNRENASHEAIEAVK